MCGFVGKFVYDVEKTANIKAEVSRALRTIEHRGPDSFNVHTHSTNFALGAVRLAMVDLNPRSNQPMTSVQNSGVLAFNGEIYNFKEIREQLEKMGVNFHTDSDTEVLLNILESKNFSLLEDLRGMFAFSYFDQNSKTLIMGRDALGKKPLYIYEKDTEIVWGSELKALNAIVDTKPKIEMADIFEYLLIGHLSSERTGISEIRAVLPGQLVVIEQGTKTEKNNFWKFCAKKVSVELIRGELELAISDRTFQQNNIALSMSGGLDSTTNAIIMRNLGIDFHGYSASWPTSDKNRYNLDSNFALEIAKSLSIPIEIVEMPTAEQVPSYFEKAIGAIGEPFNNPTAISQFALFEGIARDNHKLVITGDGADEIFAGYPRHKIDNSQNEFFSTLAEIAIIDKFFENWSLTRSAGIRYARTFMSAKNPIRTSSWHWVFNPSEIQEFHPGFNLNEFPKFNIPIDERIVHLNSSNSSRRMIFDMSYDRHVWLTDHSNKMLDRMSMAHSIEARSPFQSEELINRCLSLPPTTLVGEKTKTKMREAFPELERLVKVRQDKAGFQSPIGYWLRENRDYFSQIILDGSKEMEFSQKQIEQLLKNGFTGTHLQRVKIWTLASLFVWNKTCR